MEGDFNKHAPRGSPTSFFRENSRLPAGTIATIGIVVALVVIGGVALIGWCWWKLRSASSGGEGDAAAVVELTAVAALPVVSFPPAQHASEEPEETCHICLNDFAAGDELRQLPCLHYFHRNCLTPLQRPYCPTCNLALDGQ